MALYLSPATRASLGSDQQLLCENRSLFFDRFADPTLKDEKERTPRKDWFNRGRGICVAPDARCDRSVHFPQATVLRAQLKARLMVNLSGGVMENAGLCLDRYGMPYIPGSAVKGCARRMALQALHDWCTSGNRPAGDDLCAGSCQDFNSPAQLLTAIGLVFGWVEQDWSTEKIRNKQGGETTWKSDFSCACGGNFSIWNEAVSALCARLNTQIKNSAKSWTSLPDYAGSVAFLPSYPNSDPGLELDILTCHHPAYYEGKIPIATDTEEPVPVVFPAIAAQKGFDHFSFPLMPLRNAEDSLLAHARIWLAAGLETFGIGAKTNAGYGWFDASEALSQAIIQKQQATKKQREDEIQRQRDIARQAADASARLAAKRALEEALANLAPEQQDDKKIELLTEPQFDTKVRAFCKEPKKGGPTEAEKKAIVRSLRGPRLAYWEAFKPKATKGDLASIDQAIRALSKSMTLGKMP